MEASGPLPFGFLGDKTIRLAKSPSMSAMPPLVNRSSSAGETGLAGVGCPARHPLPWHGTDFWLEGDRRIAPGAPTEGVSPVSGAIAISDSAALPAPWSDESS